MLRQVEACAVRTSLPLRSAITSQADPGTFATSPAPLSGTVPQLMRSLRDFVAAGPPWNKEPHESSTTL